MKSLPRFRLRFPLSDIPRWAARFTDSESNVVERLASRVRGRGHLTRAEFLALCRWKTPRSQPLCARNSAARIRRVTRAALSSPEEERKAPHLLSLDGVGWPTASVILHFCDERPFPILDVRALWSLGFSRPPSCSPEFWKAYVAFIRRLARAAGADMRTVDRALWQYSKERQNKKKPRRRAGGAQRDPKRT